MKKLYFIALFLILIFLKVHAQCPVLIMSTTDGKLFVDGEKNGSVEKDTPLKINLKMGEHLLQLKTQSGKTITEKVNCVDTKQKIVHFEFELISTEASNNEILVTNGAFTLPGALNEATQVVKYYAFDKDDEIKFAMDFKNKKGTSNIYVNSYPDGQLIFSKENIKDLPQQSIKIPKRGVYSFTFSTNYIIDRDCEFVIKRIPGISSSAGFKTNVVEKFDTVYVDVLDSQVRVYSTTNLDHVNRTIVRISLPKETTYWVYWIGVGKEANTQINNFVKKLSKAPTALINPIYAFGIGMIAELPYFTSTATVNYFFTDHFNADIFYRNPNMQYGSYQFKFGKNVSSDYSKIESVPNELNLCFSNNSMTTGHDVSVKVGAFVVKKTFVAQEDMTKKP